MDFFGGKVKVRGFLVCLLVATSARGPVAATTAATTTNLHFQVCKHTNSD
jgi:hypothetical protein